MYVCRMNSQSLSSPAVAASLAQGHLEEVLPEPAFHRHRWVVTVGRVGFLQEQVAGTKHVGVAAEVLFEVLRLGADVFGRRRDDAVQVLPQPGCLFRPVKGAVRLPAP